MTLQDAIGTINRESRNYGEYKDGDYAIGGITEAVATILNAVVKGELK